ncbi:hypothetical protein Q9233_001308 [Columba guinea]|nr:hypothetical protein Q9233_001308 [Columba guinea]
MPLSRANPLTDLLAFLKYSLLNTRQSMLSSQEKGSPKIYCSASISLLWSCNLVEDVVWLFAQLHDKTLFHNIYAVDLSVDEVVAALLNYEGDVIYELAEVGRLLTDPSCPLNTWHDELMWLSALLRLISTGELTPVEACKQCIYEVAVVALAAV